MLVEPAAQERIEERPSRAGFEGAQQPGAFRVHQSFIGIVGGRRIGPARNQRLFGGGDAGQRGQGFFLLHLQVHGRDFFAVHRLKNAGGDVAGEAFIEPEVLP